MRIVHEMFGVTLVIIDSVVYIDVCSISQSENEM